MGRTFIRQDVQIANSDVYNDAIAPAEAAFETNPVNVEDDLNNVRSMLSHLRDAQAGDWWNALTAPALFGSGTIRGVQDVNDGLHAVEKKRVLSRNVVHVDVTVGNGDNYKVLLIGELPSQTTAAIGAVTTLGTVAAFHTGTFGQHSLDEVAGVPTINPKNLCDIVDSVTHDPVTSSDRTVYGLFQVEENTDGLTMTGTTTKRAQISFVRFDATGTALEAVPIVDIENRVIHYACRVRKRFEDLTEQDFLGGAIIDIPAAATVTRQVAYDAQGATPVDVTTISVLDLEGAGLTWAIRDNLEAELFKITEGSAGGTSEVSVEAGVDTFRVDAIINDFNNGAAFDTGVASTTINVGVTANQIDSGGALTVANAGATDIRLVSSREMFFDDLNQTGSTWAQVLGIKLSETTAEWDAFEALFGETSILDAINQAGLSSTTRVKTVALATANAAANIDVGGAGGGANLDAQLCNYSAVGSFLTDVDVYLNGVLLRNGANAAANHDVYPGTSPALGQIKFEFPIKGTGAKPDQITMICW